MDLVGASLTVVYVTLSPLRVLWRSGAHHAPFLQLHTWPRYRLFYQYLTRTAQSSGNHLLDNKDVETAYGEFEAHDSHPVPAAIPYTPIRRKQEPVPPATGKVRPLTLLLARNEARPTQTTVIHHRQSCAYNYMTPWDIPVVPQVSQQTRRTCLAYDLEAPTTRWAILQLILRNPTNPSTRVPAQAHTRVAQWFHGTNTRPIVAWVLGHTLQWLFTTTTGGARLNQTSIAIHYSMYKPGGKGQTKTPLPWTPPLMPHARTTNAKTHMSTPEPGHGLHPPLHPVLPHTRTTRGGTHSRITARNLSCPKR